MTIEIGKDYSYKGVTYKALEFCIENDNGTMSRYPSLWAMNAAEAFVHQVIVGPEMAWMASQGLIHEVKLA